jgi:hypothetical protein
MKKNSSRCTILALAWVVAWVIFWSGNAFAVGEYNGVWVGVDTISIPGYGSFDETTGTVIYQENANELFLYDPMLPALRLIKSGSDWVLPAPMMVTYLGYSARLTSVVITFQSQSRLTGLVTLEMDGINASATLNHSKYDCQSLKNGSNLSGLSGETDTARCYQIDLPVSARDLNINTWGGSGDCDLYLIYHRPDFDEYASEEYGNEEEIVLAAPQSGRWYAILYGFEGYSGLNLNASFVDPSSQPRPAVMPWIPLLLLDN